MVYPFAALVASCIIWTAVTRGTAVALARSWTLAILAPSWISVQVASAEIDLRVISIATAIACLAVIRDWKWNLRPCWGDAIATLLVLVQMASEYQNGGFGLKAVFQIGSQWALPYLLGRLVFHNLANVRRIQPLFCTLYLVLCLWVISEAATRVNVINRALGHRGSEQSESEIRWGLRRAEGPTSHPIFCGMLIVALFPWSLQAVRSAHRKTGPSWWRVLPWVGAGATFCTMSRGPQLALLVTLITAGFFRWPRYRAALLATVCVTGVSVYLGWDSVVESLHSWSSESHERITRIVIGGQEHKYTGTTHRLLQFKVYRNAMMRAGLVGYGINVMSAQRPSIPHVEPHLMVSPFNSVDNHYIYFMLLTGHLGACSFIALGIVSLVYIWPRACDVHAEEWPLAAGLFGVQFGILLLLLSVWFAADFGFQWLFNVGYIASWSVQAAPLNRLSPRRTAAAICKQLSFVIRSPDQGLPQSINPAHSFE
jgi:hypothetical protein